MASPARPRPTRGEDSPLEAIRAVELEVDARILAARRRAIEETEQERVRGEREIAAARETGIAEARERRQRALAEAEAEAGRLRDAGRTRLAAVEQGLSGEWSGVVEELLEIVCGGRPCSSK